MLLYNIDISLILDWIEDLNHTLEKFNELDSKIFRLKFEVILRFLTDFLNLLSSLMKNLRINCF